MTLILKFLPYIQLALSALLVVVVLIQTSEAGLGSSFGSDGASSNFRTRRGLDKVIFIATIIIAILFAASSLVSVITR